MAEREPPSYAAGLFPERRRDPFWETMRPALLKTGSPAAGAVADPTTESGATGHTPIGPSAEQPTPGTWPEPWNRLAQLAQFLGLGHQRGPGGMASAARQSERFRGGPLPQRWVEGGDVDPHTGLPDTIYAGPGPRPPGRIWTGEGDAPPGMIKPTHLAMISGMPGYPMRVDWLGGLERSRLPRAGIEARGGRRDAGPGLLETLRLAPESTQYGKDLGYTGARFSVLQSEGEGARDVLGRESRVRLNELIMGSKARPIGGGYYEIDFPDPMRPVPSHYVPPPARTPEQAAAILMRGGRGEELERLAAQAEPGAGRPRPSGRPTTQAEREMFDPDAPARPEDIAHLPEAEQSHLANLGQEFYRHYGHTPTRQEFAEYAVRRGSAASVDDFFATITPGSRWEVEDPRPFQRPPDTGQWRRAVEETAIPPTQPGGGLAQADAERMTDLAQRAQRRPRAPRSTTPGPRSAVGQRDEAARALAEATRRGTSAPGLAQSVQSAEERLGAQLSQDAMRVLRAAQRESGQREMFPRRSMGPVRERPAQPNRSQLLSEGGGEPPLGSMADVVADLSQRFPDRTLGELEEIAHTMRTQNMTPSQAASWLRR